MDMRFSLAFAAMASMCSPARAQDSATNSAPVPEKKICRSIVPTGSIMSKRFCLTKTEWKDLNAINGRAVEAMRNKPSGVCGSAGGPFSCQ